MSYYPITDYPDESYNSTVSYTHSVNAPPTPEPEADELKVHQAKPAPKKQYQCTKCLKNFSRPSALQTHSYTHTAEKPFQCLSPDCGRRFSVVSNLRRHFKVHQKPSVGNKLSSEDRLRCVRQLMKRSDALLSNKQLSTHHKPIVEPFVLLNQEQPHRYHHYLILPSINTPNNDNHSQIQSPSLVRQDQQSFTLDHNLFFNSELPFCWPNSQFIENRQYMLPSKMYRNAEETVYQQFQTKQ